MRKWTSRFEGFVKRTLLSATFLLPLILGIIFLDCSQLIPAENASVLATSGAMRKEGCAIGNSYFFKVGCKFRCAVV